jgi:tetratricopeptide (TPR) repeat protein
MTFREAKCPSCGGELRIPDDKATVKCMYCSSDVVVRQAIQVAGGANIENYMRLARAAKEADNHNEAYSYYTKVLELDPENYEAWFGKGESAGWTSTLLQFRLPEMLTAFQKTLEYVSPDKKPELTQQIAAAINSIAIAYYHLAKGQLNEYISLDNTWRDYLDHCGVVIKALERAHGYAPDDRQIIENIVFICKDNVEGVEYSDKYDTIEGMPKTKVVSISEQYETTLREKIGTYEGKLKQMDPSYQPVTIKKAKSGLCFVATATMGNEMHPFVLTLREFRDDCLIISPIGRAFINFYYAHGPRFAAAIRGSKILRYFSFHLIVHPTVRLARYFLRRK